jgi:ribosomal protein S27AE
VIAVQDEHIAEWKSSKMKGWGRGIQQSIMGGIMRDRGKLSQTVIVDRWFASSQICPECGNKNKLTLKERRYTCGCGYSEDRDRKAAHSILQEGIKLLAEAETAGLTGLALSV